MNNELSTAALVVIAAAGGLGALVAGIVAAWVHWLTEKSRAKRERSAWLRDKKLATFSTFLGDARMIVSAGNTGMSLGHEKVADITLRFNQGEFEVRLLLDASLHDEFNRLRARIAGASKEDKEAARAAHNSVIDLTALLRREFDASD